MSPTMVFDSSNIDQADEKENGFGKLLLVLGASGGPKIISAVLQVILNHIYLGMNIYDSIIHPRVHNQLLYHNAAATGYDLSKLMQGPWIETANRTLTALRKRNHSLFSLDYTGTCQAISINLETNLLNAASDPRKNGQSSGY
jgi:gamma-glutamyltranspeptidase